MRAENRIDAIERPRLDHHARANGAFLGRLEQQAHFPMDFIGHAQKNARRTEQHGHMAVMTTRMHDAFVFRRIRSARELELRAGRQCRFAARYDGADFPLRHTRRAPFL